MINEYKEKCCKCGQVDDIVYFDNLGNLYCEDCWIQHEAKIKNLV